MTCLNLAPQLPNPPAPCPSPAWPQFSASWCARGAPCFPLVVEAQSADGSAGNPQTPDPAPQKEARPGDLSDWSWANCLANLLLSPDHILWETEAQGKRASALVLREWGSRRSESQWHSQDPGGRCGRRGGGLYLVLLPAHVGLERSRRLGGGGRRV